jgi:hypothetical protein
VCLSCPAVRLCPFAHAWHTHPLPLPSPPPPNNSQGTYNPTAGSTSSAACMTCDSVRVLHVHFTSCAPFFTHRHLPSPPIHAHTIPRNQGYFNPSTGAAACQPCNLGMESGNGAVSCTDCVAGRFNDRRVGFCIRCLDVGSYSTAGASACRYTADSCPAGTYASAPASCYACEAGSYSAAGAASCAFTSASCPVGTYARAPSSCILCIVGTYNPTAGGSSCLSCPTVRGGCAAQRCLRYSLPHLRSLPYSLFPTFPQAGHC